MAEASTTVASPRPASGVSRRSILKASFAAAAATATGAAGAYALRGFDPVAAAEPARDGVFGYGVASGDPLADSVIIWTRATPPARPGAPVASPGSGVGDPLAVTWEVAHDPAFTNVVRSGRVTARAAHDHTVKVDVTGLTTYTRYWYRFRAAGEISPVGVTRTAPDDLLHTFALRFAFVSCSNYSDGWFGAYRGLAEREDLDFVLHLGDYLYEYGNDHSGELGRDRSLDPDGEIVDLTDYRLRHALYKADRDLQAAHRAHPFVAIFDDHEIANNMWQTGAGNHTPDREGAFGRRRDRALRAYLEWMPIRLPSQQVPHRGTRFFRRFTFGSLADLSVLETRQNRSKQVNLRPYSSSGGGYVPTDHRRLNRRLADPGRHLPEPEQLAWLKRGTSMPRAWHLIGNQTVLTPIRFPGAAVGVPDVAEVLNSDQWDGYQADQRELLEHLAAQPRDRGDAVVLTGDIHSSWATELPLRPGRDYESAGVEFVCPSITSGGYYETFRDDQPDDAVSALVRRTRRATASIERRNPWVKYLDGVGHGYVVVDVTPDRVHGEWYLTPEPTKELPDPRTKRSAVPQRATGFRVERGERRLTAERVPLGARADDPF